MDFISFCCTSRNADAAKGGDMQPSQQQQQQQSQQQQQPQQNSGGISGLFSSLKPSSLSFHSDAFSNPFRNSSSNSNNNNNNNNNNSNNNSGNNGFNNNNNSFASAINPASGIVTGTAPPPETQALAERMREANARLQSFANWPYARSLMPLCTPERLSGCGFYYDPDPEFDDRVSCAFCHLSLGGWDRNHDPVKEHQKISPRCPFLVQFGMPSAFVPVATFKTELVGTTWRVEDYIDDEVHVRADGAHQNVVIRTCASRTARTVVLVQGPVGSVTIEECVRIRVTILGAVSAVNVKMCEEVEITVQEGRPSPNFTIDRTNGCRLELSPGAVGGECLTSQSSAVLLVSALGVTIIKPPIAPGKKAANDCVATRWVDGHFVSNNLSPEDVAAFRFANTMNPSK